MAVRVAINGFGRIGRNILRSIIESGRRDIEVVAINDLGPPETNAHLLRFDSVHGRFPFEVKVEGDSIVIGERRIKVTAIKDPSTLPWKELRIDVALECTGIFTAKDKASAHLTAGAKRVLVSAPADGADLTVVYGVNHDKLTSKHIVVSNASCTTNCFAPMVKVLHEAFGIEHGLMSTIGAGFHLNVPGQVSRERPVGRGYGVSYSADPAFRRNADGVKHVGNCLIRGDPNPLEDPPASQGRHTDIVPGVQIADAHDKGIAVPVNCHGRASPEPRGRVARCTDLLCASDCRSERQGGDCGGNE
jgi:hypothetical protein